MKFLKASADRISAFVGFAFFYAKELILANLQVAQDVLTIHPRMRPGVIAIPLDIRTDAGMMALSNLLTMTPGTMTLDISTDRKVLYIHVLYLEEDPERSRRRIKNTFERRIGKLIEK